MAHFCKINKDNLVEDIIVIDNEQLLDEDGEEQEALGLSFIKDVLKFDEKKLMNEKRPAGNSIVNWDGKNMNGERVTSGIYFCLLKVNEESFKSKIVLLK